MSHFLLLLPYQHKSNSFGFLLLDTKQQKEDSVAVVIQLFSEILGGTRLNSAKKNPIRTVPVERGHVDKGTVVIPVFLVGFPSTNSSFMLR